MIRSLGRVPDRDFCSAPVAIHQRTRHAEISSDLRSITLADEVEPGDPILLADGTVRLRVMRIEGGAIVCEVVGGGTLSSRKGVNLPTRTLSLPAMTAYDQEALTAGLDMGVDFVGLSFVRSREDVEMARSVMLEHGRQVPIIAKIEKHEAVDNLDAIIEVVDAVMVSSTYLVKLTFLGIDF